MRRREHDEMMALGQQTIDAQAKSIVLLREMLEHTQAKYEDVLRRLAGLEDEPQVMTGDYTARTLGYGDLQPGVERKAKLTPAGGDRPTWAEPTEQEFWSGDGLSSSLDDDPLDLEPLPYQPADVDPHPEPLPETEHRDRAMGIAPGENPFQGLKGLDPDA